MRLPVLPRALRASVYSAVGDAMGPWDEMKKALRDLGDKAISSASELDARDAKRAAGDLAEHAAKLGQRLRGACESLTERSGKGAEDASGPREDSAPSDASLAHEDDERAESGKKRGRLPLVGLPHRAGIAVIAVIVVGIVLVVAALAGAPREEAAPVPPPEEHEYRIEVSGKENLLFSRYDVDVSLGDVSLGTLSHGGFAGYEVSLFEGSYPLQVSKTDDEQVSGSITFELDDPAEVPLFEVSCFNDRVEIERLSDDDANSRRADRFADIANRPGERAESIVDQLEEAGYQRDGFSLSCTHNGEELDPSEVGDLVILGARSDGGQKTITLELQLSEDELVSELAKIANQPGVGAEVVIPQLERAGYQEVGYTLRCVCGGSELSDFAREDYVVEKGGVDPESKTITLELASRLVGQMSFDEETAKRAVVVAMTNCYATDVFTADGSAYDAAKFHSYADMSGYYLTVSEDGAWSPKATDTWHVDDLVLRTVGNNFYVVVSADVTFDGTNYVVTSATAGTGSTPDDAKQGGGWTGSTDTYNPGEGTPFLTVSPSLVADARDAATEQGAIDAENAAKAEQEAYDSWVGDQFGFFSGDNDELVRLVKERLNDEGSFRHKETGYIAIRDQETLDEVNAGLAGAAVANMNDVLVTMEFTAKNGFNATIKSQALGLIRYPSGSVELIAII